MNSSVNFIVFAAVEPSFLECGSPTDDSKLHIFRGLDPGPPRFSEQKLFRRIFVFPVPGTKIKMSFITRWNMISSFLESPGNFSGPKSNI